MKLKYTILFLILLSTAVFASPEIIVNKYGTTFSLMPQNFAEDTCECGNLNDQYILENTGSSKAGYTITNTLGLAQNFNQITLKPGQKALLFISTPLQCKAEDFAYKVTAISSHGTTREVTRVVEVTKCQNLQLSMDEAEDLLPNSTLTKTIQIINSGTFEETYRISSKKLNDYVKNKTYEVIIPAKSSQEVDFVYEFPPDLYGNKTLKFEAKAIINNLKAVLEEEIQILNDYGFTVDAEQPTICTELNKEFKFTISNEGAVDNIFKINKLTGRGYTLSTEEVFVKSGDSAEIIVTPEKYRPISDELRMQIVQKYGSRKALIEIPLEVIDCYASEIIVPEKIEHCGGEKTYEIILTNTGLLEQDIELNVNFGELDESLVNLNPGEEKVVELEVEKSEGSLVLDVYSAKGAEQFIIPARVDDKCSIPMLENDYYIERNSYAQITLEIFNSGVEEGIFELEIDNNAILNKNEIVLAPNSEEKVLLEVDLSDRDFGTYAFNLLIGSDEGEEIKQIIIDYQDKTFGQKATSFLNNNPCLYFLGIMLLVAFITLMMWVFVPAKGRGSVKITGIVVIIIIAVSAALILTFKGAPEPLHPKLVSEPADLYYEVYEGDSITLDVAEYFKDEDNDELRYSIDGDVNYKIIEGLATITASLGTYTFNLVATDGEAETLSPGIIMNVKNKPLINFFGFLVKYCCWISWLLIVLSSVFLIGAVINMSEKPEKGTFEKPKFEKKTAKKKVAKKTVKKKTETSVSESSSRKKAAKKKVVKSSKRKKSPKKEIIHT